MSGMVVASLNNKDKVIGTYILSAAEVFSLVTMNEFTLKKTELIKGKKEVEI